MKKAFLVFTLMFWCFQNQAQDQESRVLRLGIGATAEYAQGQSSFFRIKNEIQFSYPDTQINSQAWQYHLRLGLDYRSASFASRDWYSENINQKQVAYRYGQAFNGLQELFPIYEFKVSKNIGERFGFSFGRMPNQNNYSGAQSPIESGQSIALPFASYFFNLSKHLQYQFKLRHSNAVDLSGFNQSSWIASHRLQYQKNNFSAYLYEAIVWRQRSLAAGTRFIDPLYVVPFNVWRPVEFALGSSDNALIGYGWQYRLVNNDKFKFSLFNELILDEFLLAEVRAGKGWWANKYGVSGGAQLKAQFAKSHASFEFKWAQARPFTYSHSDQYQSYTASTLPLGNVLGSNFKEFLASTQYVCKHWKINAQSRWVESGQNSNGQNFGSDVRISSNNRVQNYGNFIGQGQENNYLEYRLDLSYLAKGPYAFGAWVYGINKTQFIGLRCQFGLHKDQNSLF